MKSQTNRKSGSNMNPPIRQPSNQNTYQQQQQPSNRIPPKQSYNKTRSNYE